MNRLDKQEYSDLKKLTKYLDKIGYYSMLLVYDSGSEDQWIKCASVVSKNQKIKFMIAMRPYALSPEYFAKMTIAFNNIVPEKLIFNIVNGWFQEQEDTLNNLLLIKEQIKTAKGRSDYTNLWLKKIKDIKILKKMPYIIKIGRAHV